jgi:L,D-transpeptidase YcbB
MQLSISIVEEIIFSTTKLFFSSKTSLENHKMRTPARKNLIIPALCLMPCLPALANTEEPATPTTPVAPVTQSAPASNPVQATVANSEISQIIAAKQHPYLTTANFTYRAEDLDALYKTNGYQAIWLGDADKAGKRIGDVIKLIEDAPNHGLNTTDYDITMLKEKLSALKPPFDAHSKDLALYDTAISLSLLRYLHDLHYGRVNPRELDYDIKKRTEKALDLPELIKTHLAQDKLAQLTTEVEPKLPQYQKLQQILTSYHTILAMPTFKMTIKSAVRLGNPLPQGVELQQFLVATGDLSADKVDKSAITYTDTIAEGVKKFQQRHGINANGVINKTTAAAFNTPAKPAQHTTPIELAMERLRWLPEVNEGAVIMVNIPAFQLQAFDDIKQDTPTKTMRVVVGKAANHQTPLLTADMRFVDFHPYWNVPFKIARDEILPKLAENPYYLTGQNMELVSRSGRRVGSDGEAFYEQIRQGSIAIRQRPGKGNALGKVKFIFPNKNDVYMHDTPSVSLFARSRRDFSHGCVRLAEPQELANFVLKNEGAWDAEAIKKAIKSARNQRITLKNPISVFFLYNTAFFNENNNLTFYPDIYGHDAKLLAALKKPREDLSDQKLFSPKEEVPSTEEQGHQPTEAKHIDPVNTANSTPMTAAIAAVSTQAKALDKDTTLSP